MTRLEHMTLQIKEREREREREKARNARHLFIDKNHLFITLLRARHQQVVVVHALNRVVLAQVLLRDTPLAQHARQGLACFVDREDGNWQALAVRKLSQLAQTTNALVEVAGRVRREQIFEVLAATSSA